MRTNAIATSGAKDIERFSYNELANGLSAVGKVLEAYDALRNEVVSERTLENAASRLLRTICNANPLLGSDTASGCVSGGLFDLGQLSLNVDVCSPALSDVLENECPYYDDGRLSARVHFFSDKPSFVLIAQEKQNKSTEKLVRRLFLNMLEQHLDAHFAFIDTVSGGDAFPFAQDFVAMFPDRSNGRICTNDREFERVIDALAEESAKAISLLGDAFDSAFAYNAASRKTIPRRFVAILLGDVGYRSKDVIREIATIAKNRIKNNIDLILIGRDEIVRDLSSICDLYIQEIEGALYAGRAGRVEFEQQLCAPAGEIDASELMKAMMAHGRVDTSFGSNASIFPEELSMDSTEALRIPFALGEGGELQYFEIGGEAATHALISGKTGSGKSVAMHTLIMQIILNYHPDDVEIWAIDYKAVEFDWYIQHKAPHFRVIARERSDEFSYSLLDLINEEYQRRQQLFLKEGVSGIAQYRRKMGSRSMPRIVVFIDEFQIMTQAVQAYTGEKDYRKVLENLLRETRAMGISFVFCSQTIASGLGGLTDAARDQIACRLCLQQQSIEEIRETLALNGPDETGIIRQVENLRKGQAIYKRARWQNEYAPDGKAYETKVVSIVFIPDDQRAAAIDRIRESIGTDYRPKDEVIVRGEARVPLMSKLRHPVVRYLICGDFPDSDYVEWYPAAPASLAEYCGINLEDAAGSNMLVVGENDELRDSLITHSVIGWLADSRNRVIATFINEDYPDRVRMIEQLRRLTSGRLALNVGTGAALGLISALRRIKPNYEQRTIFLWYGLDRLENELFLSNQADESQSPDSNGEKSKTPQSALGDLTDFLNCLKGDCAPGSAGQVATSGDGTVFSDCRAIVRQAFERGPENNQYHMVIFNNRKGMKKSGMVDLSDFDYRIGTKMNTEDAYSLFGSSLAMNKADESTAILSIGGGRCVPLRPYLMPSEEDYKVISDAMRRIEAE